MNILIQGPDIEQLQQYTVQLMDKVRQIPGVVDVDTNFEPTQPELRINVDRARAADLGVNIDSVANSLRTLVGGEEISEYKDGDDQFKVVLRLDEAHRNPATMGDLPSRRPGKTVKVSDVATLKKRLRSGLDRPLQPAASDSGEREPAGRAARRGARRGAHQGRGAHLRPGYQAVFGGSARTLAEASSNFLIALAWPSSSSTWCLASQLKLLIHPLTIMTALPLSLPAGCWP